MIIFQSIFYVEIHQNNIFYFFKIIFKIKTLKQSKIHKKINFNKKNTIYIAFLFKLRHKSMIAIGGTGVEKVS